MIIKGGKRFGREASRILIIQLGDIGDVVWATPAFQAVKEAYPQASVSVLVREGLGSLVEADPHIHKIFEIQRRGRNLLKKTKRQIDFIRSLRRERLDLVFDLRLDDRGAFMAFLTGAPCRVSTVDHTVMWRNRLFTHLVDPSPTAERIHGAAEQSLRIVREFGIETENPIPKLWVSDATSETVRRLLDQEGVSAAGGWVSINPFARWPHKEWDDEKWIRIINWLWKEYELATVIVGSSGETKRAAYIRSRSCGEVFSLAGRTTLGELAGLLGLGCLHIGVDSAAPHIAAAVGTPTITIYGPSDWLDWAPQGAMHDIIIPDRDCAPCHQKGCDGSGTSKCLEELTVEKVQKEIQEALDRGIIRKH
ncbi:MAG: putative lipopolysaccharide heptosyltransferase III [Deltaproteobacteria bacterium]|nr:putative lipopolysaccharide heptosyltransferase III [Deltaproteobacteria bacterium]